MTNEEKMTEARKIAASALRSQGRTGLAGIVASGAADDYDIVQGAYLAQSPEPEDDQAQ